MTFFGRLRIKSQRAFIHPSRVMRIDVRHGVLLPRSAQAGGSLATPWLSLPICAKGSDTDVVRLSDKIFWPPVEIARPQLLIIFARPHQSCSIPRLWYIRQRFVQHGLTHNDEACRIMVSHSYAHSCAALPLHQPYSTLPLKSLDSAELTAMIRQSRVSIVFADYR